LTQKIRAIPCEDGRRAGVDDEPRSPRIRGTRPDVPTLPARRGTGRPGRAAARRVRRSTILRRPPPRRRRPMRPKPNPRCPFATRRWPD
jgi:hypothetical protein